MLSEAQKKHLRGIGHGLKPLILVGEAGVSESLYAEFDTTLSHHELIKIRVRAADRRERNAIIEALCARSGAALVQRVGNVALVYRENPDVKKVRLPNR